MTHPTWLRAAAAGVLLAAAAAHAEPFVVDSGAFLVTCTGTGQLCEPPFALGVGDPGRTITLTKFVYTASSSHCSAGRLHVSLDGVEIGRMRFVVGRERSVLRKRVKLRPGGHVLAFQFEGRSGGCNVGFVSGWGGEIQVKGRRR